MSNLVYPLWVVRCQAKCGFVCTVWEKPGTSCSYIKYCPDCGANDVSTLRVRNNDEHIAAKEGDLE